MLNKLKLRVRALFSKSKLEEELSDELRFHLEREIEQNLARGMKPEDARTAAFRSFGGVERFKDESRDARGVRFAEEVWQDLRYGARALLKNPGFTVVAVIALAVGIGANSAIFTVANALLLRSLPFQDADKLVQVWETVASRNQREGDASYPNFVDWREQNRSFDRIAIYSDESYDLTGIAEPERIQGAIVSGDFFPMLGVNPILGRVFSPEEEHPNKVFSAVMSERLWKRSFNADPRIIGRVIRLDGESFTVIGVVPRLADLGATMKERELWTPIAHGGGFDNRKGHGFNVIARLKRDVTSEQAQADMRRIAEALAVQYPDSNTDRGVRLVRLQDQILGNYKLSLWTLLGAVGFVLLIASANVANMLLARAASRRKEIAVRAALGAGRMRLLRQMLTESMLLSVVGGAAGLLIAIWGVHLLLAFGPADLPRASEIAVGGRVLGFTLAVSLLTGLLFGLLPALQASRVDLNEALKEGGRSAGAGGRRFRNALVVSEIALSLVLLVGAGLMIRSLFALQAVNPGFNPHNLLTMRLSLRGSKYGDNGPILAFYQQLLDQVKALPGVQSVALRSYIPIEPDAAYANLSFGIEGRSFDPAGRPIAYYNAISPEYFQTMGIPIIRGRPFDERDAQKAQNVVIINETLARRYFPGEDPIGRRMTREYVHPSEEDWATIVGIVKDAKPRALDSDPAAEMYMPFAQQPRPSMALMIRTANPPESVAAAVRRATRSLDENQPVYRVRTFDDVISMAVAAPRFRASLLGVFALTALILAMVGVYGVMSYAVAERTHEIGLRMALGARGADVLKLVVVRSMTLALAGVGVGLVASFALTRVLSGLLFNVHAIDPLTFAGVAALLVFVALLACCFPARRAMKVDPMIALRAE